MSVVEANITIHVPDGADVVTFINTLRENISNINGRPTFINVIRSDDPLSTNPARSASQEERE